MFRFTLWKTCLVLSMFFSLSGASTVVCQDLLSSSQVSEWKRLLSQYEASMVEAGEKVSEFKVADLTNTQDPSIPAFTTRLLAVTDIETELLEMDKTTRAKVMPLLIKAIQDQLGGVDALKDTGGTKAGELGFRAGYGDYDLEAPRENIDAIVKALARLVPAGTVKDHGSYIEVEHLRLIVFKRSPIRTVSDLEKIPLADLERDAGDKEVYLHLRLPPVSEVRGEELEPYQKLAKALEVQGHIKKGIHGALCNPQELIDQPEQMQTFAKGTMKSLIASGMWWGNDKGSREAAAPVENMLNAAGWRHGVMGFEFQLHAYKNWGYINPLLFQNRETIQDFQSLVRNALALADQRSKELADSALATLEELKRKRPNDPALEPLIIAAQLYLKQREVNQEKLNWKGVPDTLDALLRHFELPADFEVQKGTNGGMQFVSSIRRSGGNLGGGRGYVQATWRKDNGNNQPSRPGAHEEPSHKATLRLVIVDLGTVQNSIDAYRGAFYEDILRELVSDSQKLAAEQLHETVMWCAENIPEETERMLLNSEFQGSVTHTEMLGDPQRNEAWIDFQKENSLLVTDKWVDPVIDLMASYQVEERLTSAEVIDRMKKSLQDPQGSLLPIPPTANPRVDAEFRITRKRSRTLLHAGKTTKMMRQGLCRFGKCIVYIEEVSSYRHVQVSLGDGNYEIKSPSEELPEWDKLESPFMRLAHRRQPWRVSVELRTDGLDSRYRGVASDGVSELALAADITGDEKSLAKIASATWEVSDVPQSCRKGTIEEPEKANNAGRTRRTVKAVFVPPETAPREHTQQIRLVVTSISGDRAVSEPLTITVIPPPILMVHGIWSDYRSMAPLRDYLVGQGVTTESRCRMMQYEDSTTKSLLTNARSLRKHIVDDPSSLERGLLWQLAQSEKIKVGRVNIVAHSLGGLLSRQLLQGRPGDSSLPGDADKILKLITIATPHQGSALADWYAEWDPSSFTEDSDPSLQDFNDLRIHIRTLADVVSTATESSKLRESAFEYGPAVRAMKASPNPFLDRLNKDALTTAVSRKHIQYYFVAGTKPFCTRELANVAAVFLYYGTRVIDVVAIRNWLAMSDAAALAWVDRVSVIKTSAIAPAKLVAGAVGSQRFLQMVVGVCDLISDPDTDGVVLVNSAKPVDMFDKQVHGTLEVAANHFDVVSEPRTMETVRRWLMDAPPAPAPTKTTSPTPNPWPTPTPTPTPNPAANETSRYRASVEDQPDEAIRNPRTYALTNVIKAQRIFWDLLEQQPITAPEELREAYEEWDQLRKGGGSDEEAEEAYTYLYDLLTEDDDWIEIEEPAALRDAQLGFHSAWAAKEKAWEGVEEVAPEPLSE